MKMTKFNFRILVAVLAFTVFGSTDSLAQAGQKPKQKTVQVTGGAEDSFTHVGLEATLTLMRADSSVVASIKCSTSHNESFADFYIPNVSGNYIIKAECEGYDTRFVNQYFDFSKKRPLYIFKRIQLKKTAGNDKNEAVNLKEVEVKATKLQIAYRGDTIVYDAAAFNVPEGAMLDALVKQLPGAELKSNGEVFINGEKVSYITLNGNDFFKGKNKVILQNLPYFVVKELKAYHKTDEMAANPLMKDKKNQDFVLDVVMKREYAKGTIANLEAGIGTENRWKAKAFGTRYDDFNRLSVFANVNNINEDRTPGSSGDWSPQKQERGVMTTRQVGVNYDMNNEPKTVSLNQSVVLEWDDATNDVWRNKEDFSPSGNVLQNGFSSTKNKVSSVESKTSLRLRKLNIRWRNNLTYKNNEQSFLSQDSTLNALQLINRNSQLNLGDVHNLNLNGKVTWTKTLAPVYGIALTGNYSFEALTRDRTSSLYEIDYASQGNLEYLNNLRNNHRRNYSYDLTFGNTYMTTVGLGFQFDLKYGQVGKGQVHDYFQLAPLGDEYRYRRSMPLSQDSVLMAFDAGNSYDYYDLTRFYEAALTLNYAKKGVWFTTTIPYRYSRERINYNTTADNILSRRNYGSWQPYTELNYDFGKNSLQITNEFTIQQPDFWLLMPLHNDMNPLFVSNNNPNLKSMKKDDFGIRLDMKPKKGPKWWVKYELSLLPRYWGTRLDYNSQTGVYTAMADNVKHNWNTAMRFGLEGAIDAKRRLRYDASGQMGYVHSVDYDLAYDGGPSSLNKVNTVHPELTARLSYRITDFSASIFAKFAGNYSHEEGTSSSTDINIHEQRYGTSAVYTIPVLKVNIATDLTLFKQQGYSSSDMNSDDWVWNASLSRSFLKGLLTARIDCYDILHEVSAKSYRVNAQGRVETRYNSIPRYVMFSLAFHFTKKPK